MPHILLLVIRIHDFNNANFEVDADETEAEILRRVSNPTNHYLTVALTRDMYVFVNSLRATPTTSSQFALSKKHSAWIA